MAAPLVAVPAYVLRPGRVQGWADSATAVPDAYTDALVRAGVRPVMLAPADGGNAAEILEPFAGLVLLGGGDVDPGRYGAVPDPHVYGVEPARDELELTLAREAVDRGLPLLAICRGLQVLDVALGGTLCQHLPDLPRFVNHGRPSAEQGAAVHDVVIEPGSRLAEAVGEQRLPGCVSVHHQAADRVAGPLVVTARSPDGVIEALEARPEAGWALAVQWHPERTAATDRRQQAVFDAFAATVRRRSAAGSRPPEPPGRRPDCQ
jgi:gamma-glutamyl-gamma-aminobutyrate hydrolase PuuD